MNKKMVCPKCGEEIEINDVFKHEIEEKVKEVEDAGRKREKDLLEQMRDLKRADRDREVEFEKKMIQAEEKIWTESRKKAAAEQDLKQAELKKQLEDALKMNKDLEQKLQQGSQQTQGEVLELELEQMLKKEFPNDQISEVAKGVRGADVVQGVFEKTGKKTGVILWESKNAKWSEGWIDKLREDMRRLNANEAVLVSVELPEEIKNFTFYKGVWVTGRTSAVGLGWALRNKVSKTKEKKKKQKKYMIM